jgi:general secretion pathway protein B
MSYILDALKKAESDRKLGSVPNIHTNAITTAESDGAASRWGARWVWLVLAVLVSGLIAIVWRQLWQTAPIALTPAVLATEALPQPVNPKAAEPTLPQPSLPKMPALLPPSAVNTTVVTAPPAANSVKPKSGPAIADKSIAKATDTKPPQPATARAIVRPDKVGARPPESSHEAPPTVTATPAATEPRIPNLRELPQNIQAEIPPLAVTGYIYSKKEADRSVLINNKLMREGDQAAPGVVLEKMTPKEAIMNYKGYRYRLSY